MAKEVTGSSQSQSGTNFPWDFTNDYTDVFGFGFSLPQLISATPQTTNPFAFQQSQTGGHEGQRGTPYPTTGRGGNTAVNGPVLQSNQFYPSLPATTPGSGIAQGPSSAIQTATAGTPQPRRFKLADLQNAYDLDPEKRMDISRLVKKGDLNDNFTLEEFDAAVKNTKGLSGRSRGNLENARAILQQRDALLTKSEQQQAYYGNAMLPNAMANGNPYIQGAAAGGGAGGGTGATVNPIADTYGLLSKGNQYLADPEKAVSLIGEGYTPAQAGVATGATATGYDAAGAAATGYNVAAPNDITTSQAEAAQGSIASAGYDAFQKAQLEARYNPINQRLTQQYGDQRNQLKAQLAASGMLDAAPWRLTELNDLESRDKLTALQDAANQAVISRIGLESAEKQANLDRLQQVRIFNAGETNTTARLMAQLLLTANVESARNMTQASIATADNLTRGNIASAQNKTQASIASAANLTNASIASADNETRASIANAQTSAQLGMARADSYLRAIGLNAAQEQSLRNDWLKLAGLQEDNLKRMDAYSLAATGMVYDTYLRQQEILSGAGRYAESKSQNFAPSQSFGGQLFGQIAGQALGSALGGSLGGGN